MQYEPTKHNRRSIRLKGYDYTQSGYYFITICIERKRCLFGDIVDKQSPVHLAQRECVASALLRSRVSFGNLDAFASADDDLSRKALQTKVPADDRWLNLNRFGAIAFACWQAIPEHFSKIELDEFVIMPNHVHGILIINNNGSLADRGLADRGLANLLLVRYRQLSVLLNLRDPNKLILSVIQKADLYGSVIITNTLFGMNNR